MDKEFEKFIDEMSIKELYTYIKIELYDLYGMSEVYDEEEIRSSYESIEKLEMILHDKIMRCRENENTKKLTNKYVEEEDSLIF